MMILNSQLATTPTCRDQQDSAHLGWAAEPRSAYVHIPFCAHKCGYCDFASVARAEHLADRYLEALSREIAQLDHPREVETIFVGGGTPTRLSHAQLRRLTEILDHWFHVKPGGEVTFEANPGTLDEAKLEILQQGGVNRISIGAQSFHHRLLQTLERDHDPSEVHRAAELIAPRFQRWSIDLIFGVPGSTLDQWVQDLETALSLGPPHLSCYALIFERGTDLWKRYRSGRVEPVEEELERAMMEWTLDRLAQADRPAYEISNYAKAEQESRHNHVYWANDPYFGFGLGAARYVNGERSVNTRDLQAYLKRVESGTDPTGPRERLEPEPRARETAVLMLRRIHQGLDRRDFQIRTGFSIDRLCGDVVRRYIDSGHLEDDGQRIKLTREGLFLADSILSRIV